MSKKYLVTKLFIATLALTALPAGAENVESLAKLAKVRFGETALLRQENPKKCEKIDERVSPVVRNHLERHFDKLYHVPGTHFIGLQPDPYDSLRVHEIYAIVDTKAYAKGRADRARYSAWLFNGFLGGTASGFLANMAAQKFLNLSSRSLLLATIGAGLAGALGVGVITGQFAWKYAHAEALNHAQKCSEHIETIQN